MAKNDLIVIIFLISAMPILALAASPVFFVFGDSLTEVGNNNYLQYSLAKSNFPWYGVDYKDGQGKPTGRFTNGRTIGDILFPKLGIPSPPPYLSLSVNDEAILTGVNYASGGAGILNDTGLYFIQRLSFDDQIDCFEKTAQAMNTKISEAAANKLRSKAIYLIGIGSNDYVNNFLQPFLADGQQYTHDEFVEVLITTFEKQLRTLYNLGARNMVVHGLGPLGCIPSQRVKSRNRNCLKRVNEWVVQFNSQLQKLVTTLNHRLVAARLTFADGFSTVLDLIMNPQKFGFKVSNTSCCNVDTNIGGLCLPNSKVCSNRSEYVFWDAFHPTDAANAILAERIFETLFAPSIAPAKPPSIAATQSN